MKAQRNRFQHGDHAAKQIPRDGDTEDTEVTSKRGNMPWISIIFLRELRASVYSVSKELSFCHSCNRPALDTRATAGIIGALKKAHPDESRARKVTGLTVIATGATPDDEREYGVEGGGERSRKFLAA